MRYISYNMNIFNPVFQHFLKFNIYEWVAYAFIKNKKLARNISAGTHACGAVCLNALHIMNPNSELYDLCRRWSTGYFLYDTYFMLRYEKINLLRIAYIYHHLASSYFITFPAKQYFTDQVFGKKSFYIRQEKIPSLKGGTRRKEVSSPRSFLSLKRRWSPL